MATIEPFGLPPEDAIKWFRSKGYELGFDWRDVWQERHRQSFTVAKAIQLEILATLREAVDQAIADGVPFEEFRRNLTPVLERAGWWGEREMIDPRTGERKLVQLGSPRRLGIIYDTNLRQAHNAGQQERFDRLKKTRPYLRYIARGAGPTRRPEHQAWHNKVFAVDDPIWDTIAPMNGWGCKCSRQSLSERDLKRLGLEVSEPLELQYRSWENKRTGAIEQVPVGVDPGFAYNPGRGGRFSPPDDLPPLSPVRTASDYGRPSTRDVERRPSPPALERLRGDDRARLDHDIEELFGVGPGQAGRVTDPTGLEVEFGKGLIDYITKKQQQRERFLPHAKATVEEPYEIWLMPFRRRDGTVVMRRRYIGLFIDDKKRDLIVVVEENGVYNTYPHSSIDAQRSGYLLWSQP